MTILSESKTGLILTSEQMAAADSHTIRDLGISGEELMERAGNAFLKEVLARRPTLKKIAVLCGKGNNGGDGFVIARRATEEGLEASVVIFADQAEIKGDAKLALEKCLKSKAEFFDPSNGEGSLESAECVIDALYGIKFRGSLSAIEEKFVERTNSLRKEKKIFVAAVDLPSGSICDTGAVNGKSFECDLTVTFQAFKPVHFCFPAAKLCGERVVVDIGIEADSFAKAKLINPQNLSESLLLSSSGHKGIRGHLIVVAGAPGHSGAAVLTSRAGFRAGAGLVTLYADSETRKIAVESMPEIMTEEANEEQIKKISSIKKGAVVIGPGLDLNSTIFDKALLAAKQLPKVIDASAIRILSKTETSNLENAVLTPHPGEMAAILDCSTEDVSKDRFGSVRTAASKFNCAVVLKGAYTLIGFPDGRILVSPFANSNLGTAGSGDVLSGLIGGLLSRGFSIETAGSLAVYLHGEIGSTLLPEGVVGSLASEFADGFPSALADLVTKGSKGETPSLRLLPALI